MSVITTIEAKCKDCYKCLRSCPVKAIRMERGPLPGELHARVSEERCIFDGKCVLVCPQKAKRVSGDLSRLSFLISEGEKVAASLAPSFASAFPEADPLTIPSALRLLGFAFVQETAIGAEMVGEEHARLFKEVDRPLISSSCPAVVNLIERHYPEVIPYLAPLVSPMIAHGRYLKRLMPGVRVAFIGPCVAKHEERRTPGQDDAVDFVLTFEELNRLFSQAGIDLKTLEPGEFDGPRPDWARLFPIGGGMLKTASLSTDMLDHEIICVSGLENCKEVLRQFVADEAVEGAGGQARGGRLPRLVEMLACEGGCIGGPMSPNKEDLYTLRARVLAYVRSCRTRSGSGENRSPSPDDTPNTKDVPQAKPRLPRQLLLRSFRNLKPELRMPDEAVIRTILARTGKLSPDDELNCGACGYDSCRDKAVAVFQGMADPEMCIPYMRERAESMANLFVASTPNGIIVVDEEETIRDLNAAAAGMFRRDRHELVGKKLSTVIDPANFRKVLEDGSTLHAEVSYPELDLITYQTIFYEPSERLAMGIFANITEEKKRESHLQEIRRETLEKAQGVIDKQMEVAQKIAGLLGETTAETKVLLTKLMNVFREERGENGKPSR